MSDLFGFTQPSAPFVDIHNTRASVAEEKAQLCLRLNQLCRTPPPRAEFGQHQYGARLEGHAKVGAQGFELSRLQPNRVVYRNQQLGAV